MLAKDDEKGRRPETNIGCSGAVLASRYRVTVFTIFAASVNHWLTFCWSALLQVCTVFVFFSSEPLFDCPEGSTGQVALEALTNIWAFGCTEAATTRARVSEGDTTYDVVAVAVSVADRVADPRVSVAPVAVFCSTVVPGLTFDNVIGLNVTTTAALAPDGVTVTGVGVTTSEEMTSKVTVQDGDAHALPGIVVCPLALCCRGRTYGCAVTGRRSDGRARQRM